MRLKSECDFWKSVNNLSASIIQLNQKNCLLMPFVKTCCIEDLKKPEIRKLLKQILIKIDRMGYYYSDPRYYHVGLYKVTSNSPVTLVLIDLASICRKPANYSANIDEQIDNFLK